MLKSLKVNILATSVLVLSNVESKIVDSDFIPCSACKDGGYMVPLF